MAKKNDVRLFAQVVAVNIQKDDEGMYTRGTLLVNTVRGLRKTGEKQSTLTCDCIWVLSANAHIVQIMESLSEYDLVFIKGTFTTQNVNKSSVCSCCGKRTVRQGTLEFVTPIHIYPARQHLSKEESYDTLVENIEISNEISVMGTLTKDPQCFITPSGNYRTSYTLMVRRKFRIVEDAAEHNCDFPKIRSFGKKAESDAKALSENSFVEIDGVLQSRKYKKKVTCENCGEMFEVDDNTMEIVTYGSEYLKNYKTKAEYENEGSDLTPTELDFGEEEEKDEFNDAVDSGDIEEN